jgi:hypothetical protein
VQSKLTGWQRFAKADWASARDRDRSGSAVDRAVPAGARVVVVRVVRLHEATDEAPVTQDGGKGIGVSWSDGHAAYGRPSRGPARRVSPICAPYPT